MSSKLILMRHGKSVWNERNLFTGWVDIPLSKEGIEESLRGGEKIKTVPISVVFTSTLQRAQMTVTLALLDHESGKVPVFLHPGEGKLDSWGKIYGEQAKQDVVPVYRAWELNERMYGKLQGLNKAETAAQFGDAQVKLWRRSFDVAPPEGESLKMTAARTLPFFNQKIVPYLEKGENVLVSAHGNSIRSIAMQLDHLNEEEVVHLEIPTGEPLIYVYSRGKWTRE